MRETKITRRLLALHGRKETLTTKEYAEMVVLSMQLRQGLIHSKQVTVHLGNKNK